MFGFRIFCWKLKIYYWKYYSKIFFIIENTVHAFFITWLKQGQKKCNAHKRRNAATQTHTDSETLFKKKKKKCETQTRAFQHYPNVGFMSHTWKCPNALRVWDYYSRTCLIDMLTTKKLLKQILYFYILSCCRLPILPLF